MAFIWSQEPLQAGDRPGKNASMQHPNNSASRSKNNITDLDYVRFEIKNISIKWHFQHI